MRLPVTVLDCHYCENHENRGKHIFEYFGNSRIHVHERT